MSYPLHLGNIVIDGSVLNEIYFFGINLLKENFMLLI